MAVQCLVLFCSTRLNHKLLPHSQYFLIRIFISVECIVSGTHPITAPPQKSHCEPVHVNGVKGQFSRSFLCSVLRNPPGDCHLMEWSEWSTCELTCIDGRSFETMGRQSRSRTFIIQSFENQDSCPQQVVETRPCTGTKSSFQLSALIDQCLFCFDVRYNRSAVIVFTCRR